METNLEDASPEDLMAQLAAQFGGITATLEASQKAFEKARSKHFHAADYIFTSSGSQVNRKNKREIYLSYVFIANFRTNMVHLQAFCSSLKLIYMININKYTLKIYK